MPYNAVVFNVMIASPSDVQEERDMARKVIWDWNYQHSERTKIVLMPVGWETHTAPAMGDRPQAIINKQMLGRSDLLIGIFWTRLGTPTGEEDSGTVEEITGHRKKGKPAMLYFSSAPVPPASLEARQYELLKDFKTQCQREGLIEDYASIDEFKDELTRHLLKTVNEDEYFKTVLNASVHAARGEASAEPKPTRALSKESRDLLLEAAADKDGIVLRARTSAGLTIEINGKNLVTTPTDPRCQALWQDALDKLIQYGLLQDCGDKGEAFGVTQEGYE
ncbi:MAG: DUF4062 domain-containing protein, partial [Chloroflexi bacterium]|nr:DUF4062 domain-containing protein [Chloroflexota bacterium]